MITIRKLFITSLLITAAALSAWSIIVSKGSKPLSETDTTRKPDAFMEDVVAIMLSKEGKPTLKVSSPKMIHYAQDDSTEIQNPLVTLFRQSPKPWTIHSDFAKTSHGVSQILFWSHVVVKHPEDISNPLTTMQTAALTVFPDKQIAETDQAVTITQPDSIIHAVGMLANMDNGTVKLLSAAKGEYAPSP